MMDPNIDVPQRRISLLDYLQQRGWKIVRDRGGDEVAGLCPLHQDHHPSFYVNRRKQVFYCHGCGCGGGLARLIYLLDDIRIRAATLPLRNCCWSTLTVSIDGNWHAASKRSPIWPAAASMTALSSNECAWATRRAPVCAVT
jgi:hypothetical protein